MTSAEHMELRGTLVGHGGWVTQIATTQEVPDMILSASRGESIASNSKDHKNQLN